MLVQAEGEANHSFVADLLEYRQFLLDDEEYEEAVKFAAVTLYGGKMIIYQGFWLSLTAVFDRWCGHCTYLHGLYGLTCSNSRGDARF